MLKLFAIFMLCIGETLCIYSEMIVAKQPRWLWTFFLTTLAGVPLLLGYHYGYQAFKSIWPVMVASITTILIIEPLLVFIMFGELPTWGASVGFILGAVGLYLAINH
jgi:hypothetical protein